MIRVIKILLLIQIFTQLFLVSCNNNKKKIRTEEYELGIKKETEIFADLKFDKRIYDFGDVSGDTTLIAKYYFKNTSNNNLIINYINPDCLCTSYKISKKFITPGDSAFIQLEFNTKGKIGKQKIYTTVSANTETKMYLLVLKANIINK